MDAQNLLATLSVASPCPAPWDAMKGDQRVRFCESCQKNVYNLSAMTTAEAETLLGKVEGRLCVRFYRRTDGTVLTSDCPVGAGDSLSQAPAALAVGGRGHRPLGRRLLPAGQRAVALLGTPVSCRGSACCVSGSALP